MKIRLGPAKERGQMAGRSAEIGETEPGQATRNTRPPVAWARAQRREHSGQRESVLVGEGPWIGTVTGVPVLKNPTVAVVARGGLLESKRKLYNVPQRNTFAFWFSANVCELHVIPPDV